jgi:hypothetical protein
LFLQSLLSKGEKNALRFSSGPSLLCSSFTTTTTQQGQFSSTFGAKGKDTSITTKSKYSTASDEVATPAGENSWSKFRAPYGFEQKSSLGPAMYLSIAVFGFSSLLNDMIYYPPRVVTMLGLLMLLMYVRRH